MNDITPAEILRRFQDIEKRQSSKVSRELYDRDIKSIETDLGEIRLGMERLARSFDDYKTLEANKEAAAIADQRVNRRTYAALVVSAVLSMVVNLVIAVINIGGTP